MVKGYATNPALSGSTTFAYSCTTLEAAEKCFRKMLAKFQAQSANADAILLIDRYEQKILNSVGTEKPQAVANYYGW